MYIRMYMYICTYVQLYMYMYTCIIEIDTHSLTKYSQLFLIV